jgi:hypothetical protein
MQTMIFSRKTKTPVRLFALCERVTASPGSPHHIRELTEVGMKRGGGADTLALCGAEVAWDTMAVDLSEVPEMVANQHDNYRYCSSCAAAATAIVL